MNNDPNQIATTSVVVDDAGRLSVVRPPLPSATATFRYDAEDRIINVDLADPNSGVLLQRRGQIYDALRRLVERDDPEAGQTLYLSYDPMGRLLHEKRADQSEFLHTYDKAGRLLTTNLLGSGGSSFLLDERKYDQTPSGIFGNSAAHLTTENSYSDTGVLQVTRTFNYAGLNGRLSRENTTFADWRTTGGVKISTLYDYDNFGNLHKTTYPLDTGSVRTPTDTTNAYAHARLTSMSSNRASIINSLSWSPGGVWATLTSGNWVQTSYAPDVLNRPSRIRVQAGPTTYFDTGTYTYDGIGNVTRMTKDGVSTDSFTYDYAGRLTDAAVSANGYGATAYTRHYEYDPLGNMTKMNQPELTLASKTFTVDTWTNRITATSLDPNVIYYTNGNLWTAEGQSYNWDKRSRLQTVSANGQTRGTYGYDAAGMRVEKIDSGAFRKTFYIRDRGGRLLSEYAKPVDSTLDPQWSKDYVYASGDLVAVVQNVQPLEPAGITSSATSSIVHLAWLPNTESDLFGYSVYRSTSNGGGYVRLNSQATIQTTSFDDTQPLFSSGVGTPTYYVITAIDAAGTESRYSTSRLITPGDATPPAVPSGLAGTPEDGGASLTWSANSEADLAGYDLYRSDTSPQNGGVLTKINSMPISGTSYTDVGLTIGTHYYYKLKAIDTEGNASIFSQQVDVAPNDPSGGSGGGGNCGDHCMPGIGALSIDDLCTASSAGCPSSTRFIGTGTQDWQILYVHTDHLGSTRVITDLNGQLVSQENYFPFGKEMPTLSGTTLTKSFTGHERDSESGMYYMMARPYNPELGRFVAPDPWRGAALEDTQGWNKYAYVTNNPVSYTDPSGLFSLGRLLGQFNSVLNFGAGLFENYMIGNALMGVFYTGGLSATCNECGAFHVLVTAKAPPLITSQEAAQMLGAFMVFYGALAPAPEGEGVLGEAAGAEEGAEEGLPTLTNLNRQLAAEEATAMGTESGELTEEAIQGSREIIPSSELGNPDIPEGFSKFTTETFRTPLGPAQIHFYMHPTTGQVFYGLDYKSVFLNQAGIIKFSLAGL